MPRPRLSFSRLILVGTLALTSCASLKDVGKKCDEAVKTKVASLTPAAQLDAIHQQQVFSRVMNGVKQAGAAGEVTYTQAGQPVQGAYQCEIVGQQTNVRLWKSVP